MGHSKKIALLVGQADEEYQSNFISGFLPAAHDNGYDVAVFSMLYKYQNTVEQEQGDFNIFHLIPYSKIDAIVVLCDTIQTSGGIGKLMEEIKSNYDGPILNVDGNFDVPTQNSKSSKSILALLRHLKEEHNITDIAFLNGRETHPFSKDRLEDYKNGLETLGLEYDERKVFYGDFWYNSGDTMVEKLLRDKDHLPQAILCANDCMAIGVCKAFEKRGVNVPDDIAVVSYDCSDEGRQSPVPITSAYIQAKYAGKLAARNIHNLIKGDELIQDEPEPQMFMGESCGCKNKDCHFIDIRRKIWDTPKSRIGFESPYNHMMDDLFEQDKLEEYIHAVYSYLYQIGDYKRFYLCLNEEWMKPETLRDGAIRRSGFSDRIIAVIDANSNSNTADKVGFSETFAKDDLLPEGAWDGERGVTYFFTPLYHQNKIFGYGALRYVNTENSYDDIYRMWIKLVSRGLEMVRRLECGKAVNAMVDVNTIQTSEDSITYEDEEMMESVANILDNNLLEYHFQPIVSAVDGQIFAYEALMRSATEKKVSPLQIIKYAEIMGRLKDVEKATFMNILGILDDDSSIFGNSKIFINSIPGVKLEQEAHDTVVKSLKANPERVVIELTEKAELDDDELAKLKESYVNDGVEMAVDDYGTGYSNVTNLLRYMPRYVKIDRMLLSEIQNNTQKQHFVREIVEFSHENHIMALAEGVETIEELETVIKLGVDLIQGYYTARPSHNVIPEIDRSIVKDITRFRREKEDGVNQEIYIAGKTNRVTLMNLIKDNANTIKIGMPGSTHRDITIVGTPGLNTDIHIEIEDNYKGQIILENVGLSNIKNRPCIDVGADCDVTIVLRGDNYLNGGGIRVDETSRLSFEDDGNLYISVSSNNYYGIGNDNCSHHGSIVFEQDGTIDINANGKEGVVIGSGLGGNIEVKRGKYLINQSGDEGIAIGAINGDTDIIVDCCDMNIRSSLSKCVCVGSMVGNANILIRKSAFRCDSGGNQTAICGTLNGNKTKFRCQEADMHVVLSGPREATIIGSLVGESDIVISHAGLYIDEEGEKALVFGGFTEDSNIVLDHVNFNAVVETEMGRETMAPKDNIRITSGAWKMKFNEK